MEFIEDSEQHFAIEDITDLIVEAIIADFSVAEGKAMNIFFTSSLYEKFVNANTLLWQKPWQEIYEMLKAELAIK